MQIQKKICSLEHHFVYPISSQNNDMWKPFGQKKNQINATFWAMFDP